MFPTYMYTVLTFHTGTAHYTLVDVAVLTIHRYMYIVQIQKVISPPITSALLGPNTLPAILSVALRSHIRSLKHRARLYP